MLYIATLISAEHKALHHFLIDVSVPAAGPFKNLSPSEQADMARRSMQELIDTEALEEPLLPPGGQFLLEPVEWDQKYGDVRLTMVD